MLRFNAILSFLSLAMLVGAYGTGWGPTDFLGSLRDPWHDRLAVACMLSLLLQFVLLMVGSIVRRGDRAAARLYDRLGFLVLCGFLLAVFASWLGMGILVGWAPAWHLLLASTALAFNLGVAVLCWLVARAESRRARPRSAPNPA